VIVDQPGQCGCNRRFEIMVVEGAMQIEFAYSVFKACFLLKL